MKKVLLIIILFAIPLLVFCQSKEKRYRAGVKIAPEIGLLSLNNDENINSENGLGIGYSFTVDFIEYELNAKWSANLGIGYAQRQLIQHTSRVLFPDTFSSASVDETVNLYNVEMPLTLNFNVFQNTKQRSYLLFGGALHYQINHNSKAELLFSDDSGVEHPIDFELPRTTYSAIAGFGIEFFGKKSFSWVFEPTIRYNFLSLDYQYGNNSNGLFLIGTAFGVKF